MLRTLARAALTAAFLLCAAFMAVVGTWLVLLPVEAFS